MDVQVVPDSTFNWLFSCYSAGLLRLTNWWCLLMVVRAWVRESNQCSIESLWLALEEQVLAAFSALFSCTFFANVDWDSAGGLFPSVELSSSLVFCWRAKWWIVFGIASCWKDNFALLFAYVSFVVVRDSCTVSWISGILSGVFSRLYPCFLFLCQQGKSIDQLLSRLLPSFRGDSRLLGFFLETKEAILRTQSHSQRYGCRRRYWRINSTVDRSSFPSSPRTSTLISPK